MGSKNKAATRALALLILMGLLIWHAFFWQSTGMYVRMFDMLETGKGYLTVLYNIGLMVVTGGILGILPGVIAGLFGHSSGNATPANQRKRESRRPQ